MSLWYVDLDYGCTLVAARTEQSALRQALRRHGEYHVRSVRAATHADLDWIRAMGGSCPEGKIRR